MSCLAHVPSGAYTPAAPPLVTTYAQINGTYAQINGTYAEMNVAYARIKEGA
ncbi:hypothetical protein M2271_005724 [Streptomyces sp. LBL]|uniref:hypothetical protein n=1 Tax=Streptomyces sp. LBL TaxID=2940562 RepID=UPI0024770139|nr:hypothetical protein [Streptomyces sp. LBL]MDH6627895.1 hypothetical protein [Streptomyces sp. LBL]